MGSSPRIRATAAAMSALCVAALLALTAGTANAEIQGPCSADFNGIPVDQIDTPSEARERMVVEEGDVIAFTGTVDGEGEFVAVDLIFSPFAIELSNEPLDPEDRTFSGQATVGDYARWGQGIYEVRGRTALCQGNAFVILGDGAPWGSLVGQIAVGLAAVSLILCGLGAWMPGLRGGTRHTGRAVLFGIPLGLAAAVLVQQGGYWPLGAPLLGVAIVIACVFTALTTMAAAAAGGGAAGAATAGATAAGGTAAAGGSAAGGSAGTLTLPQPPGFSPPPRPPMPPPSASAATVTMPPADPGAAAGAGTATTTGAGSGGAGAGTAAGTGSTGGGAAGTTSTGGGAAGTGTTGGGAAGTATTGGGAAGTATTGGGAAGSAGAGGAGAGGGSAAGGAGTGTAAGAGGGAGTGTAAGAGGGAAGGGVTAGAAANLPVGPGIDVAALAAKGVLGLAATAAMRRGLAAAAKKHGKEAAGAPDQEAYWFHVEAPTAVYPLSGEEEVIGWLPGDDWYLARATYDEWVLAQDPDRGVEGFVARNAIHRASA